MPFTLAHVVAARPLWQAVRRRLPLSGVVVGSMAPDLEYLAHLDTERTISHQLVGVVILDLPLALLLLALWHGLLKRTVAALVSPLLRPPIDRSPFPFRSAGRFGLVLASILVGIAGHTWPGTASLTGTGSSPPGSGCSKKRSGGPTSMTCCIETTAIGAVLGAMAAGLLALTAVSVALRAGRWTGL